jgi:hypothetical protein
MVVNLQALDDEMDLEFVDEQPQVSAHRSFVENITTTETSRQQDLEIIHEEEERAMSSESCYIKDSLAMNHEELK